MLDRTEARIRILPRGDEQAIGLTLHDIEHVLSADEAQAISRRLADAAFGLSEAMALRLDLARLRDALRRIVEGGPPAKVERIAREALANE